MERKNLANIITFSRMFGVGFIFWITPFVSEIMQLWCIVIFSIVGFTDFLDGWIARRFNIVSDMGKVLDPLADKILVLVFLPLLSMKVITAFPVFIILAREFGIMGLRVFAAKHGYIISANFSGKLKTGITLPVCGILMARPIVILADDYNVLWTPLILLKRWVHSLPAIVFEGLIWFVVAITVWSFIDYLFKFLWQRQLQLTNGDTIKTRKYMLSFIPNSVSFVNVLCGLGAIWLSFNSFFMSAGALILIGMILDGLDGRIARKLGTHSKLGQKIDSKADYITFGIAPAVLLFSFIMTFSGAYILYIAIALALFYVWGVYYRLNRFNKSGHSDFFQGLPSPVGAALVAVSIHSFFSTSLLFFIILNIANILLMISTLPYPHNHAARRKVFFVHLRIPVLVFIALVTFRYLGLEQLDRLYVNHCLLALMALYYSAPLLPDRPA